MKNLNLLSTLISLLLIFSIFRNIYVQTDLSTERLRFENLNNKIIQTRTSDKDELSMIKKLNREIKNVDLDTHPLKFDDTITTPQQQKQQQQQKQHLRSDYDNSALIKLHTITYASHSGSDEMFCRSVESAILNQVNLTILGWGEPWQGNLYLILYLKN